MVNVGEACRDKSVALEMTRCVEDRGGGTEKMDE